MTKLFDKLRIAFVDLLVLWFPNISIRIVRFIQPNWVTDSIAEITNNIAVTEKEIERLVKDNPKLKALFIRENYDDIPGGLLMVSDALSQMSVIFTSKYTTADFLNKFATEPSVFVIIITFLGLIGHHIESFGGIDNTAEGEYALIQLTAKKLAAEIVRVRGTGTGLSESELVAQLQEFFR